MQLRQTETVCILDDHEVRVRYVHADLDYRRRNQNIVLLRRKITHYRVFFGVFHTPVQNCYAAVRQLRLKILRVLLGAFEPAVPFPVLDERTDYINLSACGELLLDEGGDAAAHILPYRVGLDRTSAGRRLVQNGYVEVAVHNQRERARDGCRGHDEHVRHLALGGQRCALCDAETVLLVRNYRAETVKNDALLDEGVRADHDVRGSAFDGGERRTFLRGGHRAGQQRAGQAEFAEHGREGFRMLRGEDFGRRHKGGLPAVLCRERAKRRRNDGLARTDIALHEAVHRTA